MSQKNATLTTKKRRGHDRSYGLMLAIPHGSIVLSEWKSPMGAAAPSDPRSMPCDGGPSGQRRCRCCDPRRVGVVA